MLFVSGYFIHNYSLLAAAAGTVWWVKYNKLSKDLERERLARRKSISKYLMNNLQDVLGSRKCHSPSLGL